MKKEKFYLGIRKDFSGNMEWKEVDGIPFSKYGVEMFLYGKCALAIAESGAFAFSGKTRAGCIDALDKFVSEAGEERFKEIAERSIKYIQQKGLQNPRYTYNA